MITISNDPISGLERRLDYEFLWIRRSRQIIIKCYIDYYKDGQPPNAERLRPYIKPLVASDTLVNSQTGAILTQEEIDFYHYAKNIVDNYEREMIMFQEAEAAYPGLLQEYEDSMVIYNNLVAEFEEAQNMSPPNPEGLFPPPPEPVPPSVPVQPTQPSPMPDPGPEPIQEYDFYVFVLGVQPIILPSLIESIILQRDSEGKFDI